MAKTKSKKECWYCFQPIKKNSYIEQKIIKMGIKTVIHFCNFECMYYNTIESGEDLGFKVRKVRKKKT